MEPVICTNPNCSDKEIGYTASPDYTLCHCGGHLTRVDDVYLRINVQHHSVCLNRMSEMESLHVPCFEQDRQVMVLDNEQNEVKDTEYEHVAHFS